MIKGVIYARYSSHNQSEQSIEGQVAVCRNYAQAHDIEIIKVYADRAIPGKTDNRPEFQQMIADSASHAFQVVVLYNTDRFARNRYLAAVYKHELRQNGVELKYATGSIPDGPEGIILEGLMESMAEYYSAELSVKVKRGMRESAKKCHATGSVPSLGYKVAPDKSYIIDEAGAEAVKLIFKMFIDGEAKSTICQTLNSRGFRTSKGAKFTYNSIDSVLKNERYIGVYKYGDIRIENGMPKIISQATWVEAQKELEKRRHVKPISKERADYLLCGKLFCGACKTPMIGISGHGKSGQTYNYYTCPNSRHKKGCELKALSKTYLEQLVVNTTIENVLQPTIIKEIATACYNAQKQASQNDPAIDYYKSKYAENQKAIDNIVNAIASGVVTKALPERLRTLEDEQLNIAAELERLKRAQLALTPEHIEFMLLEFTKEDPNIDNYRQKIIDLFISRIYVYADKIIIFYNLTGPDKTLKSSTFNRLEPEVFDQDPLSTTKIYIGRTLEMLVFPTFLAIKIKTAK